MKSKPVYSKILLIFVICAFALLAALVCFVQFRNEDIENSGLNVTGREKIVLSYLDKSVELKRHFTTALILGIDQDGTFPEYGEDDYIPFYNTVQADFIALLIVDYASETIDIIQINRDTMTDVPWFDFLGNPYGTVFEQICLAFNAGSGRNDSCENVAASVSSLLFDLPIDNYFAYTMSGVGTLTDIVGGVTVHIREDLTAIDPSFVEGADVTLTAKNAESFVRARKSVSDRTNVSRMQRHRDFFDGFSVSARKAFNSDSDFAVNAIKKLSPLLLSDMSPEQLSDLAVRFDKYTLNPIQTPQGELILGEEYYEFYVDKDNLWDIICTTLGET